MAKNKETENEQALQKRIQELEKQVKQQQARLDQITGLEDVLQENTAGRFAVLENIGEAYYEVDLEGDFTYVNQTTERILGYAQDELIGQNFRKIMDEKMAAETLAIFNRVFKGGEPVRQFDWRLQAKDGQLRYAEASAFLRYDKDGKPVGFRGMVRDVTDRHLAEKALRYSEERYRTILENVQAGYYEVDLRGNHTFASQPMSRIFGYSPEELVEMNYKDYMTEAEAKRVFVMFNGVFRTGDPINGFDYEIIRNDDQKRRVETSISLIHDNTGEPIGFRGIVRDVTQSKEAEDALRASEEKYREILQNITDGYYEVDLRGNFIFLNDSIEWTLRYPPDELVDQNYRLIFTEEKSEEVFQAFNEVFRTGEPKRGMSWEIVGKDGSIGFIESSIILMHDDDGEPTGFRGIVRDVTDRKEVEESLARFKLGLERSKDAFFITSTEGIIEYVNPGFEEIYGYSAEEALGQTPRILKSGIIPQEVYVDFWKTLLDGGIVAGEIINKAKDGRLLNIEGSNNPILDENGKLVGFLAVHRDITARKKAEAELQNTYDQLEDRVEERTAELRQAQEALQSRNEVLETLNELSRRISFGDELQPVLQTVVEFVGKIFDVTSVYMSTWNQEEQTTTVMAEYLSPEATAKERISDLGQVYDLKEEFGTSGSQINKMADYYIVHVDDPDLDPAERSHFEEYDNKSEMGVPLIAKGKPVGLLELWDSRQKHDYTPQEIELLISVGRQIATAFENYTLYEQALNEIEERRRAEAALRESESRYRLLLESSPDPIVVYDPVGNATYINSAFEATFGWERDVLLGRQIDFVPEERQAEIARLIEIGMSQGRVPAFETQRLAKNGELIDVQLSGSLIKDESGEIVASMIILRDIRELKTTQQALENRNQILETLNQLSRQISFTDELENVMQMAVAFVGQIFDVTSVYLSTWNKEAGTSTVVADYYGDEASEAERVSDLGVEYNLEEEFGTATDWIDSFTDYYVLHIDDPSLSEAERHHFKKYGNKTELGVPLIAKGKPIGMLELWDSRHKREYNERELELAMSLGRQIATTFDNYRLYEQALNEIEERRQLEEAMQHSLERRRRVVQLATRLARSIASATDLNELYSEVVNQIQEQLGYYHTQLLRYNPAVDGVVLIAGYGEIGQEMLLAGHMLPLGRGLIGSAAASGTAYLRSDVRQDPDWRPNPLLPQTRSELAVPIKLGQTVLGVLDVQSEEVDGITTEDQLALEGLCGQIAVAIESTRLRQEMRDRLVELNQLQRIMSREAWESYRGQWAEGIKGYSFDQIMDNALSIGDGATNGGIGQSYFETFEKEGVVISRPMTIRGETIGSLGIVDDPENPLDLEDQALLDSISVQVAEALESARLLEQTQKHAVEMEAVAQVSAAASTLLDSQQLLQTVVSLTKERFNLYFVVVFLLDETATELYQVASTTLPVLPSADQPPPPPVLPLDLEYSVIARSARSRKPIVVNDASQEEGFLEHPLLPDTRSEIAIPLIVGDRLLGILDIQSTQLNRFSEDEVRIHTTLAAQVAVALQNANLYAEQLETAKRLREVDRLKSEFLASMSHELRTPLNSIIGFADVLLEGIDGPLTDRMVEDVTLIRNSGRHLRELIGDILDMSKIEAGMMDLRYEQIDMKQLGKDVINTYRNEAKKKGLQLRSVLSPEIGKVEADRTRIRQVLFNLMSNAIKFTEVGGVTLLMKLENDLLHVAVRDTGIGIREEDIPIIFEQFRQIDGSLTRRAGGTGLGMPISKSLIELHGGEMWIESEPEKGSTFWFAIPLKRTRRKPGTGPLSLPGTGPLGLPG